MKVNLSNLEREKLFSLLERLGNLDQEALLEEFTEENLAKLRFIAGELSEKMALPRVFSKKMFVKAVRELAGTRRIWSGRFEEIVDLARKAALEGKEDQARWILSGFVRFCPSPYYREKAEKVIDEVG